MNFKNTLLVFLAVIFSFLPTATFADNETLKDPEIRSYNIIWRNKVMGIATATKTYTEKGYILNITSRVKMKFIMEVDVTYFYESHFENDELTYSHVYNKINGKVYNNIWITKDGNDYKIDEEGQKQRWINGVSIRKTLALAYFSEPKKVYSVFAEPLGKNGSISEKESGIYFFKSPEGNDNYFHYKNGTLKKIVIKYVLADFEMILNEN